MSRSPTSSRPSPFGVHLYHCHVMPLAAHIAKGLYGAFIVDPKRGRARRGRAGDGDERLRHQLRPARTRSTPSTRSPFHYVERPDSGEARGAGPDLPGRTCSSTTRSTRSTSTPTSSTTTRPGPGLSRPSSPTRIAQMQAQRGILELRFPYSGQVHVPRPQDRVRRARLDGVLRGGPTDGGADARPLRGLSCRRCPPGCSAWCRCSLIALAVGIFAAARRARASVDRSGASGRGPGGRAAPCCIRARSSSTVRNDGPDPVEISQVAVNDAYVPFTATGGQQIGRLGSSDADRSVRLDRGRGVRDRRC